MKISCFCRKHFLKNRLFIVCVCSLLLLISGFIRTASAAPLSFHPADTNEDKRITEGEAMDYVEGWQQRDLPLAFAMRALFLWQSGGLYAVNPSAEPPACWAPFEESGARLVLFGAEEEFVECGGSYTDPGADGQDEDGSPLVVASVITKDGVPVESIDNNTGTLESEFRITYSTETASGVNLSVVRRIYVQDTRPPVIEPAMLQMDPVALMPYGYRNFEADWTYYPRVFHVHILDCNADWSMIDSGTALDACGSEGPTDYWDSVEKTVRRLKPDYSLEYDEFGNEIIVPLDQFTQIPGIYRIDYTVQDSAGNEGRYVTNNFLRYIKVMDTTRVPLVVDAGLTREEAEARILAAHLVPVVIQQHDDNIFADQVISQSPAPDIFALCNSEVQIVVSLGPCLLPTVTGMSLEDAQEALRTAGYISGSVTAVPSEAEAGTVLFIETDNFLCGGVIHLVVSEGPCFMPDVIGLPMSEAIAQITGAGFPAPEIQYDWNVVPVDTVYDQFPDPGKRTCDFQSVLKVSLFLKPTYIDPDASLFNSFECGVYWNDPEASVRVGEEFDPIAWIGAAEIAYQSGESWIPADPEIPLLADHSPYRVTYRYEYRKPYTEEPGVLEGIRFIAVNDTLPPVLTVKDNPDYLLNETIPVYVCRKGQYHHWDDVAAAYDIRILSLEDQCEGSLSADNVVIDIYRYFPDEVNEDDPGEPVLRSLEEAGLTETTWLNTPGFYVVNYSARDQAYNMIFSGRGVEVPED